MLAGPDIRRHLLREEGEVIVDEVRHHWVVYVLPALEAAVGVAPVLWCAVVGVDLAWLPFSIGMVVLAHASWRAMREHLDRFVVTSMRVFRVHGVLSQNGRLLGFGHFCFESAAQEQGLRDIRYVGQVDQSDLAIQRVVQRSGLRGPRTPDGRQQVVEEWQG